MGLEGGVGRPMCLQTKQKVKKVKASGKLADREFWVEEGDRRCRYQLRGERIVLIGSLELGEDIFHGTGKGIQYLLTLTSSKMKKRDGHWTSAVHIPEIWRLTRLLATLGCEQPEREYNKKCSKYRGDLVRVIDITHVYGR